MTLAATHRATLCALISIALIASPGCGQAATPQSVNLAQGVLSADIAVQVQALDLHSGRTTTGLSVPTPQPFSMADGIYGFSRLTIPDGGHAYSYGEVTLVNSPFSLSGWAGVTGNFSQDPGCADIGLDCANSSADIIENATLVSQIAVTGPDNGAIVPVSLVADIIAVGACDYVVPSTGECRGSSVYARAFLTMTDSSDPTSPSPFGIETSPSTATDARQVYSHEIYADVVIGLVENHVYTISEGFSLYGSANGGDNNAYIGSANVDPTFTIPHSYLTQHPGVGLAVSPGLEQFIGTPEPSAWLTLDAGLFGVGLGLRKRRRVKVGPRAA